MRSMKSTALEKRLPHYTWDLWQTNNKGLEKITFYRNTTSNNVRQESQQLRSDTSNTISWKLKDTNMRLENRISDVSQWFLNVERTLNEVKDQITELTNAKQSTEKTLTENLPLLEAVRECFALRDRRREIDVVEDDAYANIRMELTLIDRVCNQLRKTSLDIWRQLVVLKEQRDILTIDLNNKNQTLDLDRFQRRLTPCSPDVSFKPWPFDYPPNTISEVQWLNHSVDNRRNAESQVTKGMLLTNEAWALIRTSNNGIRHQRDATEFALRRRHHETIQTRDRLAAQRKDLMDEIEKAEKEMRSLEEAVNNTRGPLKLAQTRLESRKWRRGMELCDDEVQRGLREEANHVTESRESLSQQLRDMRNVLNGLRSHLHEVEGDLERKERSLAIETTCLKIHSRPTKTAYQTDIAWLADNSYLLSSIDRGTFERQLETGDICSHNVQPPPVLHPRAAARTIDAGVMTDHVDEEFILAD